jgi:hypothetical protein
MKLEKTGAPSRLAKDSLILSGNGGRHYVEIRGSCVTKWVYNFYSLFVTQPCLES